MINRENLAVIAPSVLVTDKQNLQGIFKSASGGEVSVLELPLLQGPLWFISPSPSCSTAFLVLWQGLSTCPSFCFLWISFCGPLERGSSMERQSSLFVNDHQVVLLAGIRWSVCISKIPFVLLERSRFVHTGFDSMVKFQSFAQFPRNFQPNHALYSFCILAFTYYVINHFISFTAWPTLAFLLCMIDFLVGGARGVMVIVVGNGHGDTSSNPGQDWLHFT